MGKAKKLYYDVAYFFTQASQPDVQVIKFSQGTGPDFGSAGGAAGVTGVQPDKYGNVMARNLFAGVAATNSGRLTQQATRAWPVCAAITDQDNVFSGNQPRVCLDFIAPTGDASIGTAPAVDPATVLNPWLRLRKSFALGTAGDALRFRIYIEKQHSIEV